MSKIYLASPYSHAGQTVRYRRFEAACKAAAILMRKGHVVFSPIVHSYSIADIGRMTGDWETWKRQDVAFLRGFYPTEVVVLKLPGWERSAGIEAELLMAESLEIPVRFVEPESVT